MKFFINLASYPRKRHNYKSAEEMFNRELENLSLYPRGKGKVQREKLIIQSVALVIAI
jgi:predicted metal-dependent hydrolase